MSAVHVCAQANPSPSLANAQFAEQFGDLYRRESAALAGFAKRCLPGSGVADDLVQEVFIRVYDRGTLEGVKSPRAYLFGMLSNVMRDYLRREGKRKEVSLDSAVFDRVLCTSDVAEEYQLRDESERLIESITALPSLRDRRLVSLFGVGYKPSQIARILSSDGETVTSREVSWALYNVWPRLRARCSRFDS